MKAYFLRYVAAWNRVPLDQLIVAHPVQKFPIYYGIQRLINLNNAVFWDVAPCRSCEMNRSFGGTYRLHLQGRKISERGTSVSM
jgi:hypothetical protein